MVPGDNKSPGVREVCTIGQVNRCLVLWSCSLHNELEMDEMMGLLWVDIVVALDIFPTEVVPRYALYKEVFV